MVRDGCSCTGQTNQVSKIKQLIKLTLLKIYCLLFNLIAVPF